MQPRYRRLIRLTRLCTLRGRLAQRVPPSLALLLDGVMTRTLRYAQAIIVVSMVHAKAFAPLAFRTGEVAAAPALSIRGFALALVGLLQHQPHRRRQAPNPTCNRSVPLLSFGQAQSVPLIPALASVGMLECSSFCAKARRWSGRWARLVSGCSPPTLISMFALAIRKDGRRIPQGIHPSVVAIWSQSAGGCTPQLRADLAIGQVQSCQRGR